MHTLKEITHACGGRLTGDAEMHIERLLTDSRKLFVPSATLFIALRGDRHDGSRYVVELYRRGIRAFVCPNDFEAHGLDDASIIRVPDTLTALQSIAEMHRESCAAKVVAIAGSNGKTIVKEWLSQLIDGDLRTVRSPRSYNSQIGVALSLWNVEMDTELSIIETGISMRGEMERLEAIVRPNDVIITNIAEAHQENFVSIEEKLTEKMKICSRALRIFCCEDHGLIISNLRQHFPNAEIVSWGKSSGNCTYRTEVVGNHTIIYIRHREREFTIRTSMADAVSVENIMHAVNYAVEAGVDIEKIASRAEKLSPIGMRLEQKDGHNNCLIIDDAYNADITSLDIALDMLHILGDKKGLSRTLILSDLQQIGLADEELYGRVRRLLQEKHVTRLIGVGAKISRWMNGMPNARFFATTDEFLRSMSMADFKDEAILLKGSRMFEFERIAEQLEQKRNRTTMEISLNALADNIAFYRSKLRPSTKLLAMVKAYSYGTGSFEIAKLMQEQGVDYLGVAFADEGYDLRIAGISLPIIVMNPEEHSFDLMLEFGLEPQIYSIDAIAKYAAAAAEMGIHEAGIHIKINTGMNRSGFNPDEIAGVAAEVAKHKNIRVRSAFSHLVGSDDEQFDAFTLEQIESFQKACAELRNLLGYSFIRHILNSAGIERFSQYQCEMVRLGIGLYGYAFSDEGRAKMRNVATLKSYISQIRYTPDGQSVGYSRRTFVNRQSRIAVVPIGYADGLDRRLSNGNGEAIVRGRRAAIAGNVCMDICMLDITDIPDAKVGDEVVLFGDENPVWQMADRIGTIPYEILTGIGRRVKRVYFVD